MRKLIILIATLITIVSCKEKTRSYVPEPYKKAFRYFNKTTGDSVKFYGFTNLDTAIFYAKKEKKNILVVFSGWACMSVYGMEWKTLSLYGDNNFINNNFIITWLAVDDKTELKDTSEIAFLGNRKWQIKTFGHQNSYFQVKLTDSNTQPCLVFIDTNKTKIGNIISYTNDKEEIETFINSGLKKNKI